MPSSLDVYGGALGANMFRVGLAELVGTFFLVFAGTAVAVSVTLDRSIAGLPPNALSVALAFGLTLTALIGALGHISGAHFNPAITLALAVAKKFSWKYVPVYLVSQLIGAILASMTVLFIFGEQARTIALLGAPSPAVHASLFQVGVVEALITFLLVLVVVSMTTDKRAQSNVTAISIGFALAMAVLIGGPLTGGAVNPARALGPMLVAGAYTGWWVYIIGPVFGGICAALLYDKVIARAQKQETRELIVPIR